MLDYTFLYVIMFQKANYTKYRLTWMKSGCGKRITYHSLHAYFGIDSFSNHGVYIRQWAQRLN